jgi:DNA helicase-2/ATP-dependent DNA helicase PcrA
MKPTRRPTSADDSIRECITKGRSFFVIAGAGSGKTSSLVTALEVIRDLDAKRMRRDCQQVVCLTYTERAVAVISERLQWDDLYRVSTLHSFLWGEVRQFAADIRRILIDDIIPKYIAKFHAEGNGGKSKAAIEARSRAARLEQEREVLKEVPNFHYRDTQFSDYASGELGHDDVIAVAARLILTKPILRKILGQKYPYILVDEAQDTHEEIISALNLICVGAGVPIVGYFGDPMQQIYDKRAGSFEGPDGSLRIPKEENFRSSQAVVELLNAFRTDIKQVPAGQNAKVSGSVKLRLIQAEQPEGARGRYTSDQLDRASSRLDETLQEWDWAGKPDVKHLYLVRQMIARRLGFSSIQRLFKGDYSSTRSQDDFENGEHYLLKPFRTSLERLVHAHVTDDYRLKIDTLRDAAPAYHPRGTNVDRSLKEMLKRAQADVAELARLWAVGTVGDVLRFARRTGLCAISERLEKTLERAPRTDVYDEAQHSAEKGEWLADEFLRMPLAEVDKYCDFLSDNTEFSTQHGVKGEEYPRVLVVFDDIGSAWNNYSFTKTLTPKAEGQEPTERQKRLSSNLAYVCFSRAEIDLRIVMYTANPTAALEELIQRGLFSNDQIEIFNLTS